MEGGKKKGKRERQQTLQGLWGGEKKGREEREETRVEKARHPFFGREASEAARHSDRAREARQGDRWEAVRQGDRWRASEAAWPTGHVNWERGEWRDRVLPERRLQVLQMEGEWESSVLRGQEGEEALLETTALRLDGNAAKWSLVEGAREAHRRAAELLPMVDSADDSVEWALFMQNHRLLPEEWLFEAEERQVESWLSDWAARGERNGGRDDEDDEGGGVGSLGVVGPVGSGKNGILERAALRKNYTLLEVHAGDARSGRILHATVAEATQSTRASGRTVLVIDDVAAELGQGVDAGFGAAVEAILASALIPVAVVAEESRLPSRWRVSRIIRTDRPRGKGRALLWAMLAPLVLYGTLLEASETLLFLLRHSWDLRSASLQLGLFSALGSLPHFLGSLPSLTCAVYSSSHAALADVPRSPSLSPWARTTARRRLLEAASSWPLFQYWPLCCSAPLSVAELVSFSDLLAEREQQEIGWLAASRCCGSGMLNDEEVESTQLPDPPPAPLPCSLLARLSGSLHAADRSARLDVLAYGGTLARFEGPSGRRNKSLSYLEKVCAAFEADDRRRLLALTTFAAN